MIVNTSNNLVARRKAAALEEQRRKTAAWLEKEKENCKFVDDPKCSPIVAATRLGTPMHSDVLESRLRKLNKNLLFEFNEFNSTKKKMWLVDSRGKTGLFPYEFGVMPERSILQARIERMPNPEIFNNPKFVMDRKDFNRHGENPYTIDVVLPGHELTRGWRTVLIKLVLDEILTPEQVEQEFGSHNSPEWQNHMGKASHILPW